MMIFLLDVIEISAALSLVLNGTVLLVVTLSLYRVRISQNTSSWITQP